MFYSGFLQCVDMLATYINIEPWTILFDICLSLKCYTVLYNLLKQRNIGLLFTALIIGKVLVDFEIFVVNCQNFGIEKHRRFIQI